MSFTLTQDIMFSPGDDGVLTLLYTASPLVNLTKM